MFLAVLFRKTAQKPAQTENRVCLSSLELFFELGEGRGGEEGREGAKTELFLGVAGIILHFSKKTANFLASGIGIIFPFQG